MGFGNDKTPCFPFGCSKPVVCRRIGCIRAYNLNPYQNWNMIFNTTHNNEDYDLESAAVVGRPFNLLQRIKMGGVGSGRLMIRKISPKLNLGKLKFSEIDYANIELRPRGIIVHYTRKLERFSWIIPFYRLVIYNAQSFSIHANGNFIQFSKNRNYRENKKFIDKVIQSKIDFLELEYYDY